MKIASLYKYAILADGQEVAYSDDLRRAKQEAARAARQYPLDSGMVVQVVERGELSCGVAEYTATGEADRMKEQAVTALELMGRQVGRIGWIHLSQERGIILTVRIKDARQVFNRIDVLVEPTSGGTGEAWVHASRVYDAAAAPRPTPPPSPDWEDGGPEGKPGDDNDRVEQDMAGGPR